MKFWRVQDLNNLECLHASKIAEFLPRHSHEEYVIGVMLRGAEKVIRRATTHILTAGDLILLNPGELHSNDSTDKGSKYRTLNPHPEFVRKVLFEITGREQNAPVFPEIVRDKENFGSILRLHLALERSHSTLEQESIFISTLELLIARHALASFTLPQIGRERAYVKLVRDYLDAHYTENVSLSQLGSLVNLSHYHLLRNFRDEVSLPPHEYQNQLRIAHAKQLLRAGLPIAQVALEVGYVDQSHLSRHFKRLVGLTPGQYSPNSKNIQDKIL